MTDPIEALPLAAIDEAALLRDRSDLDAEALAELRDSIATQGLRMPIDVFPLAEPEGPYTHGLISGFRRLAAMRSLLETTGQARYATIPAFVRRPADFTEALTSMVEENAIRADISPWEQGLIAVTARDRGVFPTLDAAFDALYANLSRDKRRRLRQVAFLVEELDGLLARPATFSLRQLLRLAAAVGRGYGPLLRHALEESRARDPEAHWRLLLPILVESENPDIPDPSPTAPRRSQPRRTFAAPRHALRIRREATPEGWCLHFTGRDATGAFMDTVFDYIETQFTPKAGA